MSFFFSSPDSFYLNTAAAVVTVELMAIMVSMLSMMYFAYQRDFQFFLQIGPDGSQAEIGFVPGQFEERDLQHALEQSRHEADALSAVDSVAAIYSRTIPAMLGQAVAEHNVESRSPPISRSSSESEGVHRYQPLFVPEREDGAIEITPPLSSSPTPDASAEKQPGLSNPAPR